MRETMALLVPWQAEEKSLRYVRLVVAAIS